MKFGKKFEANGSGLTSENFIILKDGESVEGVLAGEPYEFYQHWKDKHPTVCTGRGCALCAEKVRATFRFRINMIMKNPANPQELVAKIFEQGQMVYGQFAELVEAGYDLETTKIRVSRKGSGLNDTQYTVVPVPKGELNVETLKAVRKVPLLELKPQVKMEAASSPTTEPPHSAELSDVPF